PAEGGGFRLALGDLDRGEGCAVEPLEMQQMAAVIDNGNADLPVVPFGFRLRRRGNRLHIGQCQCLACDHVSPFCHSAASRRRDLSFFFNERVGAWWLRWAAGLRYSFRYCPV